jgi:Cytidylate kinase
MTNNMIITIARQYGSGGREIGAKLAQLLEIEYYDKDLITLSAQKTGLSADAVSHIDEKASNSLLYTLAMGSSVFHNTIAGYDIPINDKLFIAQSDVIRELADQAPCIIVGRCADYVLRDYPNCMKVFIYADDAWKMDNIQARAKISANEARDVMVKTDKRRANYYNYYTGLKWGRIDNYDLALNTSKLDINQAAELIRAYANIRLEK